MFQGMIANLFFFLTLSSWIYYFSFFAGSKNVSEFELELKQDDEVRNGSERQITIIADPTTANETDDRVEWDNKCSFFLSALGFAVGLGTLFHIYYVITVGGRG